jgi:hypothetical protein
MGNNKGDWDQKPEHTVYLPPGSAGVGGDDSDIIGFRMAR